MLGMRGHIKVPLNWFQVLRVKHIELVEIVDCAFRVAINYCSVGIPVYANKVLVMRCIAACALLHHVKEREEFGSVNELIDNVRLPACVGLHGDCDSAK